MSVDYPNNTEGSMFAGTPSWERSSKKRSSLRAPKTTRTVGSAPMTAAEAASGEPAPVVRRTTTRSSNGTAAAIAIGVIAVAGIGGGAWYATQHRDAGVAQLTPGVQTAARDTAPVASTASGVAANTAAVTPPPAVSSEPTITASIARPVTPERTAATRVRPAAAASAGDAGVNTSATLPEAPLPYSAVNPDAAAATPAPTPAAPVAVTPPAAAATATPEATEPTTVNPPAATAVPDAVTTPAPARTVEPSAIPPQ